MLDMFWKKIASFLKLLLYFIVAILFVKEADNWIRLVRDFPLNDFSVYIDGAKTQMSGENPYTKWFFDRYNYPPFATVLFVPLTLLPINTAEGVMTLISLMSVMGIVYLFGNITKARWGLLMQLFLTILLLRLFPARLTINLGQINLFIIFLLVSSFYFYKKGRPLLSSFALGLAGLIKITPLPIVLFYLIKKEKKIVVSWLVTIFTGIAIGVSVFGAQISNYYYMQVLPNLLQETTKETLKTTYMNQSPAAFLGRFGIFEKINTIARMVCNVILFIITSVVVLKSKGEKELYSYSLLVTMTLLFFPTFVWQHHYVALIPIWLLFVGNAMKNFSTKKWILVVISYLAMNFYFANTNLPTDKNPFIATHFLLVGIVLWIAIFRECISKRA